MLTDAFEKPRAGVNLSDTISDKLKDYPAASSSSKSRSVIPKCFRPSTSETSPSKADLRRQLKDAQLQYEQLTYQNQHAETALSGSISETLRFDHAKRLAEAQAAQAKQELQKLQTSLQASESRAADAGQQVQREIQVLRNRVRGLTSQTQKVSSRLQIVEGGSVARLMDAAWEGGVTNRPDQSSQLTDALLSLQELHSDLDIAQQQMSLLETTVQGRTSADRQAQQELQEQLLRLQSEQWWAPQLARGSVGLGSAYVGGIWWITKGVTRFCLVPVTIPAAIVQRVYDMAKRNHDTIIYESFSEGFINSQEGEPSHDPHGQNPMLGKAFKMEE
ncbi:TPA: hypothetical protein ACH3X2_013652 [Trebouxia sp. C0005]